MTLRIRAAERRDTSNILPLLIEAAEARNRQNSHLWALDDAAGQRVSESLENALSDAPQGVRQTWLLAEEEGALVGVAHGMMLPVPPIYAAPLGQPGLILSDLYVTDAAPAGTDSGLIWALEGALQQAGAKVLLAAHGPDAGEVYAARGYQPLTLYLSKSGLSGDDWDTRGATEADLAGLVALSARHRGLLKELDPFWTPHVEADERFLSWMRKSLSLPDRDMRVSDAGGETGYVIAQPATRMHIPAAHVAAHTGIIDDFHHTDMANAEDLCGEGAGARALLSAAEGDFAARGTDTVLAVCPAAWTSKRAAFEAEGYDVALIWSIRRPG